MSEPTEKKVEVVPKSILFRGYILGIILMGIFIYIEVYFELMNRFSSYQDWGWVTPPAQYMAPFFLIVIPILALIGEKRLRIHASEWSIIFTFYFTAAMLVIPTMWLMSYSWAVGFTYPEVQNLIPKWWNIGTGDELNRFRHGGPFNFGAWAVPTAYFVTTMISACLAMCMLSVIWRRQWVETERLPFPFVTSATEFINLGKRGREIFKENMLWAGILVGVLVYIWDIFHLFNPIIPHLIFQTWLSDIYSAQATSWFMDITPQTKGYIGLHWSPFTTMFAYFLPVDVLFTIWVYGLIMNWFRPWLGKIVGVYPDISELGWFDNYWAGQQGWYPHNVLIMQGILFGAFCLYTIWHGRGYIKNVLNVAFGKRAKDFEDEPAFSYRYAVVIFVVCSLIWLGLWLISGATWWMTIILWVWIIAINFAVQRLRGENVGKFWDLWTHHLTNGFPAALYYIPNGLNTTREGFTTMCLAQWGFLSCHGNSPWLGGSAWAEPFKVSREVGGIDKHVVYSGIIAVFVTVPLVWGLRLYAGYSGWDGTGWAWDGMGHHAVGMPHYVYTGFTHLGFPTLEVYIMGMVVGFIMMFLKMKFVWWPINPAGMIIGGGWFQGFEFLSILSAWAIKYAVWKIGGVRLHRRVLMFAIGFIAMAMLIMFLEWLLVATVIGLGRQPPP